MPQMSCLFWLLLVVLFIKFYMILMAFIYFEFYLGVEVDTVFDRRRYWIKFL